MREFPSYTYYVLQTEAIFSHLHLVVAEHSVLMCPTNLAVTHKNFLLASFQFHVLRWNVTFKLKTLVPHFRYM